MPSTALLLLALATAATAALVVPGCQATRSSPDVSLSTGGGSDAASAPPPAIAAWMEQLTVAHTYDPQTGFIVADEVVPLPPVLANAPSLEVAIARAGPERIVLAFATADRCAPCQQFKKDALNDPVVMERLAQTRFLSTHVEVDHAAGLAESRLGSRSIPMTYALRDGVVVARLRGQRSAAELIDWLDALPAAPSPESDAGGDAFADGP